MDRARPSIRRELQEPLAPEELPSSRVFHEGSKMTRARQQELAERFEQLHAEGLVSDLLTPFKSYPGLPQLPLPRARLEPDRSLEEAIVGRRSVRAFDETRPVTLQELANLLQLAYGITGRPEPSADLFHVPRALPSAGALYPLELYLIARRIQGLPPGLYHYRVAHHALEALEQADQGERLLYAEREWGLVGSAAFHLVVAGVFDRTMTKYRERGYRFVLMEAGMLGYAVNLLAECQGISSCMMGGWRDAEVERLLGLDGFHESVLHVICFGRPPRPH